MKQRNSITARHIARLALLSTSLPDQIGDTFLELRRWEADDGSYSDLIAEYGFVDGDGELLTIARILPFHLTLSEALTWLQRQPELMKQQEFGRRGVFGATQPLVRVGN